MFRDHILKPCMGRCVGLDKFGKTCTIACPDCSYISSKDPTFCHLWCYRWACCYLLPLGSPLYQRLGAFELGSFISGLIWVPHFQFSHPVPYRSIYRPNRNENALCTSSRWPSLVYAPLGSSLVQRFGAFGLGSYIFVLIWVPHFCFSRVVLYRSIYRTNPNPNSLWASTRWLSRVC